MEQINISDYKSIYLQTAKENLDKMSIYLNELTRNVLDKEALNHLYISSHSLRSKSQVMEFMEMADLTGKIEKKSKNLLSGSGKIDNAFLIFLKESISKLNLEFSKI